MPGAGVVQAGAPVSRAALNVANAPSTSEQLEARWFGRVNIYDSAPSTQRGQRPLVFAAPPPQAVARGPLPLHTEEVGNSGSRRGAVAGLLPSSSSFISGGGGDGGGDEAWLADSIRVERARRERAEEEMQVLLRSLGEAGLRTRQ